MDIDIEYLQTVERPILPSVTWTQCTEEQIKKYQCEIDKQIDQI